MKGDLWPIRYIQASVAVKIFPVLQFWILPDCCLDSVYIWECWDRRKTGKRSMQKACFTVHCEPLVLDSPFGGVYQSVENILTTSVTAIILLVVGYSMELNAKLLKPCIATIILRVLLQAVMIAGVLVAVHYLVGDDRLVNLAIISYMSAPATFSMQTFLRKKESSAYASTTNSLYCVVSILVYITLAVAG